MVLPVTGDIQIGEPVVVVITHGHTDAVHFYVQARGMGYVGESAVTIVPVKVYGALSGKLGGMPRPVHAVHQDDIQPPVVVVVEKRAAGAQRFRKVLLPESAVVVLEGNSRLPGAVNKMV